MAQGREAHARAAKRVVIVGGGFAGLNAAKELGARGPRDLDIVVIDRRNHHLFQPLLYQVAMAGLSPADISTPIRSVLVKHRNVAVRLGTVTDVDLPQQQVVVDGEALRYDYLVLACGATHSYFGHDQWENFAPGLKTLEQATEIRRRVLTAFEKAEIEKDPEVRRELLTFVVVGGGPTGVELAGALGELSRFTLGRDFRNIDPASTRVILIEGGPRVLPMFDPELSAKARRDLERLGVTVWTERRVTDVTPDGVRIGEEFVAANTVLWAAGVEASDLNPRLPGDLDRAGRVKVQPDLSLPGHPNVFVIGDQAHVAGKDGEPVPGLAPAAIQQGKHVARNIARDLQNAEREPFEYFDKGMMATIGRASGVVQTGNLRLSGFVAWLMWCFIHIFYLIGFRNRMIVFVQWVWSYVRYRRGARLITERDWRDHSEPASTSVPTALPPRLAPTIDRAAGQR